jgi:hypothetical protein
MQMDNGTALNVTGTFNNSGSIQYLTDPAQLMINVGATLNNSGTITGGVITVGGNLANSGLLIPAELTVQGTLSNPGQVQLTRGVATVGGLDNCGQISVASGTISDQGNLLNSYIINVGVANPNSQSNITVVGTLTNTTSGYLNMGSSYGLGIILNAGSLVNSGQLQLSGLTQVQINGNLNNSGVLTTTSFGSNAMYVGGQFTNSPSGVFQLAETGDTATITNLINQGRIVIGNGATLTIPVGASSSGNALAGFLNAGSVLIQQGGEISSFGKYTQNTGQTTVDGQLAGIINFNGGSVYGNGGTISGSLTSNASINFGDAPITVGQLTFAGNYTQRANGSLTFDIAGQNQYDKMNVTGQAHLNGLMTVDLLHGYIPQIGNMFEIMTFAEESGTFSNVVGLPIDNQEHFVLEYNSTNLTLDVVAGQLAGITSVKLGSGNSISYEPFIQTADSGSGYQLAMNEAPSQSTPEPGSLLLFSSGLVTIGGSFYRRRKRQADGAGPTSL